MPETAKPKIAIASANALLQVARSSQRQVLADRQFKLLETWERDFGPIPQDVIEEIARLGPD